MKPSEIFEGENSGLRKAFTENIYHCIECRKESRCTKPTIYKNCPCGANFNVDKDK